VTHRTPLVRLRNGLSVGLAGGRPGVAVVAVSTKAVTRGRVSFASATHRERGRPESVDGPGDDAGAGEPAQHDRW
jgi:hypothetical protein